MKLYRAKHDWTFYQKITKNKSLEVQLGYRKNWDWWMVSSNLTRKCDHAGLGFELEIMGIFIWISFYDGRHWNHKENSWKE